MTICLKHHTCSISQADLGTNARNRGWELKGSKHIIRKIIRLYLKNEKMRYRRRGKELYLFLSWRPA